MQEKATTMTIKLGVSAAEIIVDGERRVSGQVDWLDGQTRKATRDVINRMLAMRKQREADWLDEAIAGAKRDVLRRST